MKKIKSLLSELPSKKVVMAFGRFQPPGINHGLVFAVVKKIAQNQSADHFIFASKTQDKKQNPLPVDRKVYFLNRMFPKTNFVAANEEVRTFIEAARMLSKKYKHLVMVAGSDRVPEYEKILNKYNGDAFTFETIEVVSAGERDPDSDSASGMSGTKMREAAKKGDFDAFKRGLPHTLTNTDGRRLMNEIRQGLGLDAIREQVKFETNELREAYHAGKIFNIGDAVTDGEKVYEVVDRGANYITVVNEGVISKKWLDSVQPTCVKEDIVPGPAPEEISFKGYVTKNLHHSEDATKAFQTTIQRYNDGQIKDAVAILNALKATDTYMKINDLHLEQGKAPDTAELASWHDAHDKARDSLNRIGEFMHHFDYWHTHEHEIQDMENKYTAELPEVEMADSYNPQGQLTEMKFSSADKIKVARVIAGALGVEDVEKSSSPEQLVNTALRKIRSKPMRPEYISVLHNMLQTAKEADIKYDEKLVPQKVDEAEYWQKKSWQKKMADAAKRERLAREKKEKEQVKEDLDEAIKLGSKVKMHAPGKDYHDQVGHVGEIRHGAYKGAPKTYTVDYGDRKSVQLGKERIKLHKEESELSEAEDWELKRIHSEYKGLKSLTTAQVHTKHKGQYKVTSKYTPAEVGGKQGMIDDIMHNRHGQKRMAAYHALSKKQKDALSEEALISELIEQIATSKLLGKDTTQLQKKLTAVRAGAEVKDNESDIDGEQPIQQEPNQVGHSMIAPDETHHVRRMKVNYRTEEADPVATEKKKSEKEALEAKQAKEKETLAAKQQAERDRLKEERAETTEDIPDDDEDGKLTTTSEEVEDEYELDLDDKDLDAMVDEIEDEEDIIDAYDDDELAIVDDETGEHIADLKEEVINEVLSRMERMKAKARFARTATKRERRTKIALKSRSTAETLNKRARRLAISVLKKRMAKKPLDKLSIGEKERLEKAIQRRKALVNRLAMKMTARVRKIENDRLSHKKYTK